MKLYITFAIIFLSFLIGNEKSFSQSKPNILLIIVDDGRYQDYASTGGPSWFNSPAINSIAADGVNFKNSFVVLSLCEPSRVSMLTGKYAHHNGFITNAQVYDTSMLTIARILRNNGYYTGIDGKFLNLFDDFPTNDFNWYFSYDGNGNYNPKIFTFNGNDTLIQKNVQQAINEFGIHFLETAPADSPFFLIFSGKAPHVPYTAYPGYAGVYHSDTVSFPTNFYGYVKNYPSYLYYDNLYDKDSIGCDDDIKTYYETLMGMEVGVDTILKFLQAKNILDSTLIIFMSDNGVFIGEHHLDKKRFAYEESIHVPLFIRYPKWFAPNTVVENQFSLNIDLFPTMLEAAGIEDTFHDDGISLRKLADGSANRNMYMCEYFYDTIKEVIPSFRAIRDFKYKYIRSSCDQQVEEFFDLTNDIKEDSNLIFKADYQDLISLYRNRLDSLRIALGDTATTDTVIACSLLNADTLYWDGNEIPQQINSFFISPNPASDKIIIHATGKFSAGDIISLSNIEGKQMDAKIIFRSNEAEIFLEDLSPGSYLVTVKGKNNWGTKKFIKTE